MRKTTDGKAPAPRGLSDRGHLIFSILAVIGLMAAPLLTGVIHIEADSPGEWLVCFLFYLAVTVLIVYVIAWIVGLAVALSQREQEKEELEDAKKY